jgi:hypothetical protein
MFRLIRLKFVSIVQLRSELLGLLLLLKLCGNFYPHVTYAFRLTKQTRTVTGLVSKTASITPLVYSPGHLHLNSQHTNNGWQGILRCQALIVCILLAQVKRVCWYQCDVSAFSDVMAVVQDCGVMLWLRVCVCVCFDLLW